MTERLKLFDDFARADAAPDRQRGDSFSFLNRSAWRSSSQIRDALEEWFAAYPDTHAERLRGEFRSKRPANHYGAFFELVVHEVLRRLRCEVSVEEELGSGKPDFLVAAPGGDRFLVEATAVSPASILTHGPLLEAVIDELNELHCPEFFLRLADSGELTTTPPLRDVRRRVQAWLDRLDCSAVERAMAAGEGAPTFDVHHNGWKLSIEARPRSKAARGREGYRPVGISPTRGGFVDSASPLRDAAMRKGKKYPEVDLPFIVAVDALDPAGVDRDDAADALFGKEQVTRAAFPDGRLGQPVLTRSGA